MTEVASSMTAMPATRARVQASGLRGLLQRMYKARLAYLFLAPAFLLMILFHRVPVSA